MGAAHPWLFRAARCLPPAKERVVDALSGALRFQPGLSRCEQKRTPCAQKRTDACEQKRTLRCALPIAPGFLHLARDEKHCQQLAHRIAPPFVREVLASFRSDQLSATSAAAELGIGRTRFYELYADYLRACSRRQAARWLPGVSGGDHAASWPPEVEPLLRKLLSSRPPSGYSSAASEIKRRLDFQLDPATVRRFALANGLAPKKPAPKPRAAVRRWQCSKIGALWQLDATPHRWWPEGPLLPLLNMLDDCSRRRVGARIYAAENLPAYLDFLPRAFLEHGLPLRLYVDCHSFFLSTVPDALTQLGTALHFYDISFRYAPTPQAKGKIERSHQDWQNRIPALLAADALSDIPAANLLLADLCRHRDTHERHRELAMTPLRAWQAAQKEGRTALRPAPKCPWWPYVWSLRSTVTVAPDGRVPAGSLRVKVPAPPGTRLVHCLHPSSDISILRSHPKHGTMPALLFHLPAS